MPRIKSVTRINQPGIRPLNEDKVLVNESRRIFGVFDGASSLDAYLSPDGKTGAYIAASIAAGTFADINGTLGETAMTASRNIEAAHLKAGIDLTKNINRFGTTAAVVKVLDGQAELLQVGDSIVLVITKDGRAEAPLGYHDHDIEIMRKWRQLANEGTSNIRGIVSDDVIKLRESANSSYGMLNGDEKVKEFLQTTTIDLEDVATILLLTDGMFIPKPDPDAEENWDTYAQLYRQNGLNGIYNAVREKEDSDPELLKYPRYKLHDDASAVAIDLE